MSGWIKLHRSFLDNKIFIEDKTAWIVFLTLLALADRNGVWIGGRKQLAGYCGLKESTVYKAAQRLVFAEMISVDTGNKANSIILICNWEKYQLVGNSPVTHNKNINNNYIYKLNQKDTPEISKVKDNFSTDDNRGKHSPAKEKIRQALRSGGLRQLTKGG